MRSFSRYFAVALFLALVALPIPGLAGLAIDFTTATTDFTNDTWSLGWEFNVLRPFTVRALGFYDDLKDGLTQSHDVGIWDSNQTLLVAGTVVPGDPLTSWWRWTGVTPVVLAPGENYRIAAVTGSENYTWDPVGFVTDPRIQFVIDRWSGPTNNLTYPVRSTGVVGYFGPNFSDLSAGVPEPATCALIGGGLLALALAFRRRAQA